jgi:hypothetical protein
LVWIGDNTFEQALKCRAMRSIVDDRTVGVNSQRVCRPAGVSRTDNEIELALCP